MAYVSPRKPANVRVKAVAALNRDWWVWSTSSRYASRTRSARCSRPCSPGRPECPRSPWDRGARSPGTVGPRRRGDGDTMPEGYPAQGLATRPRVMWSGRAPPAVERVRPAGVLRRSVSGSQLRGVAKRLDHGGSPRRRRCARPAGAAPARAGPHPAAAVGVDVRVVVGGVGVPASRAGAVGGRRAHGVLRWGSCRGVSVSLTRLCRRGGGTGRHPRAGVGATWGAQSAPRGAYLWRRRPVTVERTHPTPATAAACDPAARREEERRCVHARCCTPYLWR